MENQHKVSCSGGNDSQSKHPLVYLTIEKDKAIKCPYCSKKFSVSKNKDNKLYIEAHEMVKT